MGFPLTDLMHALPEILVILMASSILILDLFLDDRRRAIGYWLAVATLIVAGLLAIRGMVAAPAYAFHHMFVDDLFSGLIKAMISFVTAGVLVYSRQHLEERGMFRGEYPVLVLFGVVGMMVMASAAHFLTLYLGLELLALCLYALTAFQRDSSTATEAAMKYFVLGALASGMLLYGMSMLYGATGSLEMATVHKQISAVAPGKGMILVFGLVFLLVGIAFKLGVVPFHMWVPDVYHGAPTPVTLFIASAPKLAALAMIMRLLAGALPDLAMTWRDMLIILAVLSMAAGNLIAIAQDNLKRMLAYSTISHMGFFLLGILSARANGYSAAMFYMTVYAVTTLAAFGMILLYARKDFEADRLDDYRGLSQRSPWHAFLMLIIMFSMAGVPPTAGFYAKFLVIQSVVDAGLVWLAAVAVLMAVIGAFYYLRVVKLMYFDAPSEAAPAQGSRPVQALLSVNALLLLALTPWVGPVIDLCAQAIKSMG
jgi:NADH-quinone oxidoreductase subunit N